MLITKRAGGLGLTLVRATRIILYDPHWNPTVDTQAIDRARRIGQTNEVHVFRLLLAGSIEEKIYGKQVHKEGLQQATYTDKGVSGKFDQEELENLFTQVPNGKCDLLDRCSKEEGEKITTDENYGWIEDHTAVIGMSNHEAFCGDANKKRKNQFAGDRREMPMAKQAKSATSAASAPNNNTNAKK